MTPVCRLDNRLASASPSPVGCTIARLAWRTSIKRNLTASPGVVIHADRYRELVEGLGDYAIVLLDKEGVIQSWNAGCATHRRATSPTRSSGSRSRCSIPRKRTRASGRAHELAVARDVGRFEDEGWRVRKDGSQFWANVVITAMRDDDGRAHRLLENHARPDRAADARRSSSRRSEERFRLLVERVKDYAIFMLTPEGRVATWNAGAQRIKGYAASEIIGQHFSRFYEPEAVARALAGARARGRAQPTAASRTKGWRVRKDGTRFWANVVITALHDEPASCSGSRRSRAT